LNRGRHLYSAGRPSRWALAHISSTLYFTVLDFCITKQAKPHEQFSHCLCHSCESTDCDSVTNI